MMVTSDALYLGVVDLNMHLREMCGGKQLVTFSPIQDWVYEPSRHMLTFDAKQDAPKEAVRLAERVSEHWSFAPLSLHPHDRPIDSDFETSATYIFRLY